MQRCADAQAPGGANNAAAAAAAGASSGGGGGASGGSGHPFAALAPMRRLRHLEWSIAGGPCDLQYADVEGALVKTLGGLRSLRHLTLKRLTRQGVDAVQGCVAEKLQYCARSHLCAVGSGFSCDGS